MNYLYKIITQAARLSDDDIDSMMAADRGYNRDDSITEIELSCANSDFRGSGKGEEICANWELFNQENPDLPIRIRDADWDGEWHVDDYYKEGSVFVPNEKIDEAVRRLRAAGIEVDIVHFEGDEITNWGEV